MPADPLPDRNLSLLWGNLCRGADLVGLLRCFRPCWPTRGVLLLQPLQVPISALVLSQSNTGYTEYVRASIRVDCRRGVRFDVWSGNRCIRGNSTHDTNHVLRSFLRRSLALPTLQASEVS